MSSLILEADRPWVETGNATQQATVQEYINKLIEFRQAVYQFGFRSQHNALFDLLDALLIEEVAYAFLQHQLSYSDRFHRTWGSVCTAVEDEQLDPSWLLSHLTGQLPCQTKRGIQIFALDSTLGLPTRQDPCRTGNTPIKRPRCPSIGDTVVMSYSYSLLDWIPGKRQALGQCPLDVRRIASTQTAEAVGVTQIQALYQASQTSAPAPNTQTPVTRWPKRLPSSVQKT